ncbi:hypothetical protein GCM10023187_42790 [Nibrella viscosa]|uniref:GH26 domain-containing protein n=1 Tax=Nibrella viscosa TaxID=1084524 RepID=A0ABP8KRT3_9BACT
MGTGCQKIRRAVFSALWATNAIWVWSPHPAHETFENFYPGHTFVDWVGTTATNYGTVAPWRQWWSFREVIGSFYDRVSLYKVIDRLRIWFATRWRQLTRLVYGCARHPANGVPSDKSGGFLPQRQRYNDYVQIPRLHIPLRSGFGSRDQTGQPDLARR